MMFFKKTSIVKIKNYSYYRSYDIFSLKERNQLLKYINSKLMYFDNYPIPQTPSNLHKNPEFKFFLEKFKLHITEYLQTSDYSINACWSVFTDGSDSWWHVDKADYTLIYYLKNKNNKNGTIISLNNEEYSIGGHQNSLIIHSSKTLHRSPITKNKIDRYVISVGINLER